MSISITGTITDSSGASASFSTSANTDQVTISSATVSPDPAPPGTLRTLTVVAQSAAGLPLTAALNPVAGITFTPVPNQPPGTFQWTFVY